ncbi:cysteine dioxygenase family protein [Dyella sp.]|jgi:predicted metal-dependent enzyme (double-stranded beta helix superfamily)|uniref:cysteine dioxygenase n=1 Tax=Dyella sp. TaxID=1869338 RepID=UPI002D11F4DB|nr:cysteine dioxygenase family protein [Dyella sp.]HTC27474.1 cysteine dioxygenase family protein [Dyella sp.]
MSNTLTTSSIAPWGKRVLALIDACMDRNGHVDTTMICERLTESVRWPDCPHAPQLASDATSASYRRIALNDGRPRGYEALVIAWPPGHVTPIHDHDGLWGLELVLDGVLQVDSFHLSEDPSVALNAQDTIVAGVGDHVLFTDTSYAHQCRNFSRNSMALSLHVYGGELNSYRSFHHDLGQWVSRTHRTVRETSDT